MLKNLCRGICAGILISLGGGIFLACEEKIIGAMFFSLALVCICMLGYTLYTGKICYISDSPDKAKVNELLFGLLGNIIGTAICGIAVKYALPSIFEAATKLWANKLSGQVWWQTLIRAAFCGMLVYLSVEIYKKKNTPLGIILCIPSFILSGYEHSIADMFYYAASDFNAAELGKSLLFLILVVIGNSIGGLIIPLLMKAGVKNER